MSDNKRNKRNKYKQAGGTRPYLKRFRLSTLLTVTLGLIVLTGISLGLVFMHDFLTQWDYFNTTQIRVQGNQRLSRSAILNQTQIHTGDNILSLNLDMARLRLLSHPWVADAEIARILPATIVISIREHVPLAILDIGRPLLLNASGDVFKEKSDAEQLDLPVIAGLDYADLRRPENLEGTPLGAAMEILKILSGEPDALAAFSANAVAVDRDLGLTLYTSGPIKSVFMGYDDYTAKYDKLNELIAYMKQNKRFPDIDAIDVSNPDRIVARPVVAVSAVQSQKGGSKCKDTI